MKRGFPLALPSFCLPLWAGERRAGVLVGGGRKRGEGTEGGETGPCSLPPHRPGQPGGRNRDERIVFLFRRKRVSRAGAGALADRFTYSVLRPGKGGCQSPPPPPPLPPSV